MPQAWVQILGDGGKDAPPSLSICYDRTRILFNCGEGLQRLSMEHKVRLSRMSGIFLTSLAPETIGGLPGAILTLADTGISDLNIHGPENLGTLLYSSRRFVRRDDIRVRVCEYVSPSWVDCAMLTDSAEPVRVFVHSILPPMNKSVCASDDECINHIPSPLQQADPSKMYEFRQISQEWSARSHYVPFTSKPDSTSPNVLRTERPSLAFMVLLPAQRGKFYPERAKLLGVKPGPSFGKLAKGLDISLPDGTEISASQCCDPSIPPCAVFVISLPTLNHLRYFKGLHNKQSILERFKRQAHKVDKDVSLECVYHIAPTEVLESDEFKELLTTTYFDNEVRHVCISSCFASQATIHRASIYQQTLLHTLNSSIFPLAPDLQPAAGNLQELIQSMASANSDLSSQKATHRPAKHPRIDVNPRCRATDNAQIDLHPQINNLETAQMDRQPIKINHLPAIRGVSFLKMQLLPQSNRGFDFSDIMDRSGLCRAAIDFVRSEFDRCPDIKPLLPVIAVGCPPKTKLEDNTPSDSLASRLASLRPTITGSNVSNSSTPFSVIDPLKLDVSMVNSNQTVKQPKRSEILPEGVKVVFLGTGSAIPSKYRNVSAIWIQTRENGGILLDAGEGTYGQLGRRFGIKSKDSRGPNFDHFLPSSRDEALTQLKLVWISHLHADHHLGLPQLIEKRFQLMNESCSPLVVIGPAVLKTWLYQCCVILMGYLDTSKLFTFYSNEDILAQGGTVSSMLCTSSLPTASSQGYSPLSKAIECAGISKLSIAPVLHCPDACAIRLNASPEVDIPTADGWSITYSGDCAPCDALVELGRDCDLLIHEATFEDGMEDEAQLRLHSTVSQALAQAEKMNARSVVLSHFSARYPKFASLPEDLCVKPFLAFDMVTLDGYSLATCHRLLSVLRMLYGTEGVSESSEA